jgi:hypothetical protein
LPVEFSARALPNLGPPMLLLRDEILLPDEIQLYDCQSQAVVVGSVVALTKEMAKHMERP